MDEDFIDVTQSGNKVIGFVLITIIVAILVFGYFFVFKKINFGLKNVKVEIGSTLSTDVNDYLKKTVVDTSGYELDLDKVKINEVGEYTYKVTYNKKVQKARIEVVDTKAPVFEVQDLKVEAGDSEFYLGDCLTKCEDPSKPCLVTFKDSKDEEKMNKPGEYNIKIKVSDLYKNSKEATVHITVVEKGTLVNEKETDLIFAKSSVELKNFKDEYYEKLDKALDPDSEEARDTISYLSTIDLEEYVKKHYPDYTLKNSQIILMYNKSNYVMGFVIEVTIDNGKEKIVYVTKDNESEETKEEE